uniref:Uncharacterized protein n=1 Tax=Desertifilum tharense IPPAS B-1220 TaxID=1781255 RepID=A0ACD5H1V0_9CYAN
MELCTHEPTQHSALYTQHSDKHSFPHKKSRLDKTLKNRVNLSNF